MALQTAEEARTALDLARPKTFDYDSSIMVYIASKVTESTTGIVKLEFLYSGHEVVHIDDSTIAEEELIAALQAKNYETAYDHDHGKFIIHLRF
jgi:hypothetical protein